MHLALLNRRRSEVETAGWTYLLLLLSPLALLLISLLLGRYPITPEQMIAILKAELFSTDLAVPDAVSTVFFDIRLPRIIAALLIGAALSVSGTAYQGVFKNPMVSPDILGDEYWQWKSRQKHVNKVTYLSTAR